ncbi:MAG TPA: YdcF family protein [Blastocatellia bacterium]|jgi:uncharacterized SAM-binding protein YcdF (DUF218 family)
MNDVIRALNHYGRSKRARVLLIVSACLAAVYFLTPVLLNEAAEGLIREDGLVKADVIVALGGDNRCNREKRAAELYHQGWADNVVVSGLSYSWGFHTGEAARKYVMSLGVPAEKVAMISDTLNTRTEARALNDLMRERGWNSAIIVTSAFHSRRATYTVERAAPGRTFYSSPVPTGSPEWTPRAWWARRDDAYLTVREFTSWANTLAGGWQ